MAEKNKSFVLYGSYWSNINSLEDQKLGLLFRAVYHDYLGLQEIDLSDYPDVQMAFSFISSQLRRDQEKWIEIAQKRSIAGKESGRRRREQKEQKVSLFNTNEHTEQVFGVLANVEHDVDVDKDVNVEANVDIVGVGLRANIQYYEIFFWRNVVNPRKECDRFMQYYEQRNWTLERGKVLSTIADRKERARAWDPEGVKGGRCRVDPTFLNTWKLLYLRAKEIGAPADVLLHMLDEGVTLEKSNMNPHGEHHFVCLPDVSEYLNANAANYVDIYDKYICQTGISEVFITSIVHRQKTK